MRYSVFGLVLVLSIASLSVARMVWQESASQDAGPQKSKTEMVTELLKTQLKAAQEAQVGAYNSLRRVKQGFEKTPCFFARPADAYNWSVRWLDAQRELSQTKADRIAALRDHHERMKKLKEVIERLVIDNYPAYETSAATWYVAEAELWLLKEQAK